MKKHLLAIALFALCTTGLNAASPKKEAPEKKGVETINRATAEAHIGLHLFFFEKTKKRTHTFFWMMC